MYSNLTKLNKLTALQKRYQVSTIKKKKWQGAYKFLFISFCFQLVSSFVVLCCFYLFCTHLPTKQITAATQSILLLVWPKERRTLFVLGRTGAPGEHQNNISCYTLGVLTQVMCKEQYYINTLPPPRIPSNYHTPALLQSSAPTPPIRTPHIQVHGAH